MGMARYVVDAVVLASREEKRQMSLLKWASALEALGGTADIE